MSSVWSQQQNETPLAWLQRLHAVNRASLDESYRKALAAFIELARKKWHGDEDRPEPEDSATLSDAKEAFLRLQPSEREQFVQWLTEIGEVEKFQ